MTLDLSNANRPLKALAGVKHCRRVVFGMMLVTLIATGCSSSTAPAPTTSAADPLAVESSVEHGPVKVTVSVTPKKARLSDEPTLTVSIEHEPDVEVKAPPFGESLGEFLIRDFHEPLPKIVGNRQLVQQVYTLEPKQTGTLTVAPITVTFTDTRSDGDGKEHAIETEPLAVEITTMLQSEAPKLSDLKPPTSPVEIDAPASTWPWVIGIALGVVLLSAWLISRFAKGVEAVIPELSAEEQARRALDGLVADELHKSDVKGFYVELTGIVRRFIERTTNISAPELTTDEFLQETVNHPAFSLDKRSRLREFLESADLVKYAGFGPNENDIQDAIDRARRFTTPEVIDTTTSPYSKEVAS